MPATTCPAEPTHLPRPPPTSQDQAPQQILFPPPDLCVRVPGSETLGFGFWLVFRGFPGPSVAGCLSLSILPSVRGKGGLGLLLGPPRLVPAQLGFHNTSPARRGLRWVEVLRLAASDQREPAEQSPCEPSCASGADGAAGQASPLRCPPPPYSAMAQRLCHLVPVWRGGNEVVATPGGSCVRASASAQGWGFPKFPKPASSPGQGDALTWTSQDVLQERGLRTLAPLVCVPPTPLCGFPPSLQLLAFRVCDLGETLESWTSVSCPVTRQ